MEPKHTSSICEKDLWWFFSPYILYSLRCSRHSCKDRVRGSTFNPSVLLQLRRITTWLVQPHGYKVPSDGAPVTVRWHFDQFLPAIFWNPWSNKSEFWLPERDNPWILLFSSQIKWALKNSWLVKVSLFQKDFLVSSILPKNEWKNLTLLLYDTSGRIVFVGFLGEIEKTENTFRN